MVDSLPIDRHRTEDGSEQLSRKFRPTFTECMLHKTGKTLGSSIEPGFRETRKAVLGKRGVSADTGREKRSS